MKVKAFVCVLSITCLATLSALRTQSVQNSLASTSTQAASTHPATFKLPDPSGPFGIGRVGYEWTDISRPDRYSPDPSVHRALMVYLWYPSTPNATGLAEPYWPGAKQMNADTFLQRRMKDDIGALWPLVAAGELKSHAIENAPHAISPNHFPVVIFSHGLGSTGFEYTSLIEDLASHGYVVAAIEHTYTASAVTFPNGRVVAPHHDPEPPGLSPEQRWQRMIESATLEISRGADDVRFVRSKLEELNRGRTQSFPLAGRLDLTHVAAMRHSAGGDFAARACQLDARFQACVSLDGEMLPVMAFPEYPDGKGFQQPVLLLEVDHSGEQKPYSDAQYNEFLKKKDAQLKLCPIGSYDVLLKSPGLVHGSFSDYPLRAADGNAKQTDEAIHNLRLIQSFVCAFLDKHLKDEKEPLLDSPSQSPESTVMLYGRKRL